MDSDFADFLLDESEFNLHQKKVDDADFLEGLKIFDSDEEEFLLTDDFEPEAGQNIEENVDFDIPFEITSEDLALLEAQEKEILKNNEIKASSKPPPKKQIGRRTSLIATSNKENSSTSSANAESTHEINQLKVDLELYKDKSESLGNELNSNKRQILTKEGEITILRQRLNQLDNEKTSIAQKYSELTESTRKTAEKIENNWKKEVESLKTELQFKEQELRSISSSSKRKIPKSGLTFDDSSFGTIKTDTFPSKAIDASTSTSNNNLKSNPLTNLDDLEIFSHFVQKCDLTWKFSELKEFDSLDILKAREFASDEIRRILDQDDTNVSGKALAHGIVKLFERALYFKQPILLTYVSQLLAQLFDKCGDRIKTEILLIRDLNGSIIFFQQISTLLTGRIILDGIPKEIIINIFIVINVIIYQFEMKIPEEFKVIANSGFLQWILRWEKFTGSETEVVGITLYSLSCDLSMLSTVFLSSATDKIDCLSVLDLLLSRGENLMDSLFPRGRIYRSRFGSQLPLLEDEVDRLHKVNVVLSLLFSFVHRSLGPVTLWMPESLIISQVIWAIDVFDHDLNSVETLEFLPPKALIAQDSLLSTIFSGLASAWHAKELVMPEVLREIRIPLLYVTQQISNHTSSFSEAVNSASALANIIEREVSDDVRSVFETGLLPRSKLSHNLQ